LHNWYYARMSPAESPPAPPVPGALLSEAGQKRLEQSEFSFEWKEKIDLPSFAPGQVECEWKSHFVPERGATDGYLTFTDTATGEKVAELSMDPQKGMWYVYHRFVFGTRKKGVGSFLLATAENYAHALHARNPDTVPHVMHLRASMPSVIKLGLTNGYEISDADRETWDRFQDESNDPANQAAYKERGELPSFLRVKLILLDENGQAMDELERDDVIIDKAKFAGDKASNYTLMPDHLVGDPDLAIMSKFKVLRMRYGVRPSFLLGIEMTKDLTS